MTCCKWERFWVKLGGEHLELAQFWETWCSCCRFIDVPQIATWSMWQMLVVVQTLACLTCLLFISWCIMHLSVKEFLSDPCSGLTQSLTKHVFVHPLCFKSVKPNAAVLKNALRKPGSPFYQHQSCCTDCHIHENRNRPEADRSQMYHFDDFRVKETASKDGLNMGVSKIWGTPQWMVSFLKCLVKWMIWGYTRFRKHPYVSGLFFFATQIFEAYCTHGFWYHWLVRVSSDFLDM